MRAFFTLLLCPRVLGLTFVAVSSLWIVLAMQRQRALEEQIGFPDMELQDEEQAREARRAKVVGRIEARVAIARAVIDEQWSTVEALEGFHALEASRPDFIAASGKETRQEKEERLCRTLRFYIEGLLERQPETKAVVLERLDREMTEHLRNSAG